MKSGFRLWKLTGIELGKPTISSYVKNDNNYVAINHSFWSIGQRILSLRYLWTSDEFEQDKLTLMLLIPKLWNYQLSKIYQKYISGRQIATNIVEFLKICVETPMPKRHHNQKLLKSI